MVGLGFFSLFRVFRKLSIFLQPCWCFSTFLVPANGRPGVPHPADHFSGQDPFHGFVSQPRWVWTCSLILTCWFWALVINLKPAEGRRGSPSVLNAPSLEALPSSWIASCTQYLLLLHACLCRGTAHFIPIAAVLPSAATPASALPINCLVSHPTLFRAWISLASSTLRCGQSSGLAGASGPGWEDRFPAG